MTTGHRIIVAAIVVALAQVGFLGWLIAGRAAILRDGQEIVLKVEPVDPRDLLRGDYVRLGYEISSIPVSRISNVPADRTWTDASDLYVRRCDEHQLEQLGGFHFGFDLDQRFMNAKCRAVTGSSTQKD